MKKGDGDEEKSMLRQDVTSIPRAISHSFFNCTSTEKNILLSNCWRHVQSIWNEILQLVNNRPTIIKVDIAAEISLILHMAVISKEWVGNRSTHCPIKVLAHFSSLTDTMLQITESLECLEFRTDWDGNDLHFFASRRT